MAERHNLTVFFDGACPLCQREVAFYQRRKGADRVRWVDVHEWRDDAVVPGLSKAQALSRFHVLHANGQLVSGGRAFAALWSALPGFRSVGRLFLTRPLAPLLDIAYAVFLSLRPALQVMVPRRSKED